MATAMTTASSEQAEPQIAEYDRHQRRECQQDDEPAVEEAVEARQTAHGDADGDSRSPSRRRSSRPRAAALCRDGRAGCRRKARRPGQRRRSRDSAACAGPSRRLPTCHSSTRAANEAALMTKSRDRGAAINSLGRTRRCRVAAWRIFPTSSSPPSFAMMAKSAAGVGSLGIAPDLRDSGAEAVAQRRKRRIIRRFHHRPQTLPFLIGFARGSSSPGGSPRSGREHRLCVPPPNPR